MGTQERQEVAYLTASGDGAITGQERHIQSIFEYWPRCGLAIQPNSPENVGGGNSLLQFPEGAGRQLVPFGLEAWKQWYASDARQAISRYEVLQRQFDETPPPERASQLHILRLNPRHFAAFTDGMYSDWGQENWELNEDDVRKVQDGDVEALTRILSRKGTARIEIDLEYDFEIVPLPDVGEPR